VLSISFVGACPYRKSGSHPDQFEDNLADMAEGGQGTDPTTWCLSPGMPRVTNGYGEIEFVITPETLHILVDHVHDNRRIFTGQFSRKSDAHHTCVLRAVMCVTRVTRV
jgi:hypothetical protein